jgi:transcriptional regulator NrdR family protein
MSNREAKPEVTKGLVCSHCGSPRLRVVYTRPTWENRIRRRRECQQCGKRMTTWEQMRQKR